jgi:DNA-binding NarL/FixJ family response regulator
MENKTLRVLVGDDEIAVENSLLQRAFLRNYGGLADFEFETDPDRYIGRARDGKYDALLVDLNWKGSKDPKDITGFRVLQASKDYARVRLLHTSNELDMDLRSAVLLLGATGCVPKYKSREYMRESLEGADRRW